MWILVLARFDFNPPERYGRTTITYEAGQLVLARRVCAEQAIERGVAIPAERPAREAR